MERKTGAKPHPGGGIGPEEVSGNTGEEIPDDTDINEASHQVIEKVYDNFVGGLKDRQAPKRGRSK